jgi:hypothetical protein
VHQYVRDLEEAPIIAVVTYSVRAGSESLVAINIPRASSQTRSYVVTTSFRAENK